MNHLARIAAVVLALTSALPARAQEYHSRWAESPDRRWVGPELWANRLQDWRVLDGRLECVASAPRLRVRTVHLLTHRLAARAAAFELYVETGLVAGNEPVAPDSAAGFLIGAGGDALDYRAAAIIHQWPGRGAGILAVLEADGRLVFRDHSRPDGVEVASSAAPPLAPGPLVLRLSGVPTGDGDYRLLLEASRPERSRALAMLEWTVPAERLVGNVALVSDPGSAGDTTSGGAWWFRDWSVSGAKLDVHPGRTFGPIAGTQYTLSRGILKLTAQMMPLGAMDARTVRLLVEDAGEWRTAATAEILEPGFTAPFRVEGWDATRDVPFRVEYDLAGRDSPATWSGTIRRDPVDKEVIVVAGFTGNHNISHSIGGGWGGNPDADKNDWEHGVWFPHADLTQRVAVHDPDVLFFSGDQVYEGKSPTFADRAHIQLDYLYKWYLWVWAYRHLTRDIPTVTIPDDHDVYQGNVWGEGGRKAKRDHFGGYVHPAEFVKMVDRTQTSHLPDPYDPTPIEQGIGVYYTSMTYGRVSFAILEDRKFKSGPAGGRLPPTGTNRPDHINDPEFDVQRADVPGVTLLGERQLAFLADWAADWRGADMKLALSQTVFANMATHHGSALTFLIADLDSNGWPQTGRNKALRELRRGFAAHLCGDQHLATLVHHGIDAHDDAIWSMCVPSVANFYPRGWWPRADGAGRPSSSPPWMGRHRDGFGNLVTVWAASNPGGPTGHEPADLHDKMPGYGIVKLDKAARTYTFGCWPRWADPGRDPQYPGWPKTVPQLDNYARKPAAFLPTLEISGRADPVVQVIDEATGEVVYTLRIRGDRFRPMVFDAGVTYRVRVGEPDENAWTELAGVRPARTAAQVLRVDVR